MDDDLDAIIDILNKNDDKPPLVKSHRLKPLPIHPASTLLQPIPE